MKYAVNYNFPLFYELGGRSDDPPYCDYITDGRGQTSCRLFVCADCVSWESFRKQALIAAQAHMMQKDPMYDNKLIARGSAAPIANNPHYLLDQRPGCYAVYINVQCPDADEYEKTKVLASLKIDELEKAKQLYGEPLWRTQVTAEFTRYPVLKNEIEPADLADFLKQYGLRS